MTLVAFLLWLPRRTLEHLHVGEVLKLFLDVFVDLPLLLMEVLLLNLFIQVFKTLALLSKLVFANYEV